MSKHRIVESVERFGSYAANGKSEGSALCSCGLYSEGKNKDDAFSNLIFAHEHHAVEAYKGSAPAGFERLSVNVSPITAEIIRGVSEKRRESVTETIRRAVAVLKWVEDASLAGDVLIVKNERTGESRVVELI